MTDAKNKTVATKADVDAFIAKITSAEQRADAAALIALMTRLSGKPAILWGPSIIGFGVYHYKYESGREADFLRIGFSPRKGKTTLYLMAGSETYAKDLARLGKHKTGKSCVYVARLADVDVAVLEQICAKSLAAMAVAYPVGA
jgi:Domain of unknown function (DU1801)